MFTARVCGRGPAQWRAMLAMRRFRRGALRAGAVILAAVLAVTLLGEQPVWARPPKPRTLSAQQVPAAHGTKVAAKARPADLSQGANQRKPAPVVWPGAGTATVDLTTSTSLDTLRNGGRVTLRRTRAAGLPILAGPPAGALVKGESLVSAVRVGVRDRASVAAAWRNGVVLDLARSDTATTDGRVNLTVDYAAFAGAFGGDWGARLHLVALPACALSTPDATGCAAQPVPSQNDTSAKQVSADVSIAGRGGVVLALTAGSSSSAGDFTATSLQASSTWSAGGNAGGFSWNYPVRVPPSLGGPTPQVSFAYSSTAVDGRSESTNNQPSWVGEGFDWWPGYIERRYKPCAKDMDNGANNTTKTGDECWGTDNATMSLNGSGGELIKDGATSVWKIKNDDNSTVERLTNTVNGDNDNEYWKITTANGTQYFFGLNRLPGYTGTAPADKTTNSAWTEPVAGNNPNEPCHQSGFVASFCTQAWRWNLDYVVDTHGNTMSLFYSTETNKYGRNNTASDAVSYVRGGWLDHIDYGTDNRSGMDTENTSAMAPMRVQFGSADRCLSSCATHDDAHWPDTPWDQSCTGSSCPSTFSPTFWTTKRLSTVTTKVLNGTGYKDVDLWTLTHNFPDPGDGTRAGLWLESIVRTGKATGPAVVGGDIAMPEVNFDWVQMPNRVDTVTDGKFPMNWMRMSTIWTDTGAKIDVRYTGPECVAGSHMPASPQTNTLRCYPVLEEQPDKSIKTEYFHKYLVTSVTEADRTGGGPDVVTNYEYVGTPAWRHTDDDGITPDNLRTWSDYRGYGQVNTRVGEPTLGAQTLTETVYFRGMNGDLNGSGGTRTVTLPAIDGNGDGDTADTTTADAPAVNDEDAFDGMTRQTTIYNGVESEPLSTKFNQPWQSAPTATRDMGQTTVYARHVATKSIWASTKLSAGGWRASRSDATFDSYGMVTQTDDQGDVGQTGDEQCANTTYNRNTATNLLSLTSEVDTYALSCAKVANPGPTNETDIISMSRTFYDHHSGLTTPPTKGEVTQTDLAKSWSASGGPSWLPQSTSSYDAYGRANDVTDVRSNHTTTVYTPASGAPVTSTAVTTLQGTVTTTIEPSWGTASAVVDINSKRTEATTDSLGRTTQVWLANHLKASFPTQPSTSYGYTIRNSGGVNAISTSKLNANSVYMTTYELFDGLLRSRQSQSRSQANGTVGTVFTETKYDSAGRSVSKSRHFDPSVQPSTTLFTIADWQPKNQTVTNYDRASREIAAIEMSSGSELWRTTTTYGGDRVSVTPAVGGTATTTVGDSHNRTTELRQYHNPADVGSNNRSLYDLVSYHYNGRGDQDSVTDNAGNTWTYTNDLLGRQTFAHDPDKGDTTISYNDFGDVLTSTDSRGQTVAYSYDTQGRKTGLYTPTTAGTKLATWAYDPPGFKGQLASSSRWENNGTDEYKIKVRSYTPLYQSTGEDYTIPAALTGLSGTYTVSRTYKVDGSPATTTYPAAGGLGGETVTYTYDDNTGLPEQLQTNAPGLGQYVSNTDYTAYGEIAFVQFQNTAGNWIQRSYTYDDTTRRLAETTTIRQISPQGVDDTRYTYDASGNITKIAETPASGAADVQCFASDYAHRLTEAWTPSSGDCGQTRSVANLGGPAPYWQSWTFDAVGSRKTQTTHTAAGDIVATSTYPAPGTAQPHAVQNIVTAGAGVNRTDNYGYDNSGNTQDRPGVANAQHLVWDLEGHLSKATENGQDTTYTYAADGTRLVMSDPTSTTLYLPNMEIKRAKSTGTVTATRYYTWSGQICAMLTTGGAVTWLLGDPQGTQQIAVAAGNQAITQRRFNPYGGARGTNPTWANPKGFVGGDTDAATGLTHLGAREYDAAIGRFLSVDPVLDLDSPQQLAAYSYANNSPVTSSDPTGLDPSCNSGNAYADYYCHLATDGQTGGGGTSEPSMGEHSGNHDGGGVQCPVCPAGESAGDAAHSGAKTAGDRSSEAGRNMHSDDPAERSAAAKHLNKLRNNKWLKTISRLGRSRWVKWGGRALVAAGFVLNAVEHFTDGDGVITSLAKAAVVTGTGLIGGAIGEAAGDLLGGLCGPAVEICAPIFGGVLAGVGSYFGSEFGEWLVDGPLERAGVWKATEKADEWVEKKVDQGLDKLNSAVNAVQDFGGSVVSSIGSGLSTIGGWFH
jgi:RHS repeat-associated protein